MPRDSSGSREFRKIIDSRNFSSTAFVHQFTSTSSLEDHRIMLDIVLDLINEAGRMLDTETDPDLRIVLETYRLMGEGL